MSSHLQLVKLCWSGINSTILKVSVGVTRAYDFTIKRGFIAPDGVNKSVILVNGQFPAVSFSRRVPQLSFAIILTQQAAHHRSQLGIYLTMKIRLDAYCFLGRYHQGCCTQ